MERQKLIDNTINKVRQLPDIKIIEVNDFADFLLSRFEDEMIREGIQKMSSDSGAFVFLKDEENLYSVNDVKESYKSFW
jgi:hypothetical protein